MEWKSQRLMTPLSALPPKQALLLLLAEKQKRLQQKRASRVRIRVAPEFASTSTALANSTIVVDKDGHQEVLRIPHIPEDHSLVLDRSHPLSDLYYKRQRFKVYWGGRGAAKSWGFAEALIRLATIRPLRILCAREFQNSIKDSSHKLLKDTIWRLGLQDWFDVTATNITSKVGSEFMFKGLFNNEQSIKSTEGLDIIWVEEGQTVSEYSWRTLIPTLRKPGSELWISFNLLDEMEATYRRFVVNADERMLVHKINYDSNPYFPEVSRLDMEADKKADYHLYEHIWLGMPLRISNAIIMSGKYRSSEFAPDLWKAADRLFFGVDWGFAQDPTVMLRMFIIERDGWRKLFIEYEAYDIGVELDDLPELFDQVPGSRDWPIKADSARPETISHVRRKGFNIEAAEKWEGSVEDGIAHLRGYDEIVIHPRCVHTLTEARLYKYKVDPKVVDQYGQPQVLPVIVDKHNHCWDAARYGLDGHIQRSGASGVWARIAEQGAVPQIMAPSVLPHGTAVQGLHGVQL